jgi:hypothetical protein
VLRRNNSLAKLMLAELETAVRAQRWSRAERVMCALEGLSGVALPRASLDDAYALIAAAARPHSRAAVRRCSRRGGRRQV